MRIVAAGLVALAAGVAYFGVSARPVPAVSSVDPAPEVSLPRPVRFPEALASTPPPKAAHDALATLKGRVDAREGSAPADVSIVLERQGNEGEAMSAEISFDHGDFVARVSPGTWRLVVRSPGFVPAAVDGVPATAGEELAGIDVLLERGEAVYGRVVSGADGSDIADCAVSLEGQGFTQKAFTDEEGRFAFEGLPAVWEGRPTSFLVRAFYVGMGADQAQARAGDRVSLVLDNRAKVRGVVLRPDGKPAAGASVVAAARDPTEGIDAKDPYGAAGGEKGGVFHMCVPAMECNAHGEADDAGRFELAVPDVPRVALAASVDESKSVPKDVALPSDDVQLVLEPPLTVAVSVSQPSSGGDEAHVVFFVPEATELAFAADIERVGDDHRVEMHPWPGVAGRIELLQTDPEVVTARLEPLGPLPDGVTVDAPSTDASTAPQ